MIIGIGVDLCGIDRMQRHLTDDRFLTRYFTEGEREYILSRKVMAAASLAATFAAKEAFAKALGTGIDGMGLHEIEVVRQPNGAPAYRLHGRAELMARELGVMCTHLSISHEGDHAIAMAVLEG